MPNIGAVLKEEISRLARREIRRQVQATKKASAQYRRHIAALKRQVATLERQVTSLRRQVLDRRPAEPSAPAASKTRFVAKGVRAQRARLGLSAADYGRLVGASAQSISNWEQGRSKPRAARLAALAALRSIGKRDAQARLKQMDAGRTRKRRKS